MVEIGASSRSTLLLSAALAVALGTAATGCGLDCGEGTLEHDGECLRAAPPCQAGTHEEDGVCVADVACGAGTHSEAGACVPDVDCGAGTHAVDGECVADVACGAATHPEGGVCVPDDLLCGDGTRLEGDVCVWDDGLAVETPWETDLVVVDGALGYRAEVSLDVDSQGNAYAAWIDVAQSGMSWVEAAVLPSGATAFDDPVVLDREAIGSGGGFFQGDPTVLVDGMDRVYVGWCNYFDDGSSEVVVASSDDAGASWSDSVLASPGGAGNFNDRPWLAVAPGTGTLYVTYLAVEGDYDYFERVSVSEDGGESWETSTALELVDRFGGFMTPYFSPIVATSAGELLIPGTRDGYEGETSLFIARRDAAGTGRFQVQALDFALYGSRDITWGVRPMLAETGDGALYLTYIDAPDGQMGVYLARSTDGGHTFGEPLQVSGAQGAAKTLLWMDVDEDGEAHLVWLDNREGQWRVVHRHTTGGGSSLSPLYAISDETFSGSTGGQDYWLGDFLGFAVRDGWAYAAWTDSRQSTSDIYFSRAPLE